MIGVSDKSITKIEQILQAAVNEAIKWLGQNKLTLNIDKCNVLKGLAQAKIIKNRRFYFGFLKWPYDVNMSIDLNCKSFLFCFLCSAFTS